MVSVDTHMAKQTIPLKITNANGSIVETELSIELFREFYASNSNGHAAQPSGPTKPDFAGMKSVLSPNARKFLTILQKHAAGISAEDLATAMGFTTGTQIGGVTGGGLVKLAIRFNIEIKDLYTMEVSQQNGKRKAIYRPGRDIAKVL